SKVSDLVVETWVVDPSCGEAGSAATAKVEATMRRPEGTKSEIGRLAETARKAKIQPHAMHLSCDDYPKVAPPGEDVDGVAKLGLVTRELGRLATQATKSPTTDRPWVFVYGGALHNDRFPERGTEEWSYAKLADQATGGHFVEIDLIVPELAEGD